MMRNLFLLLVLFFGYTISAQSDLPVSWKTVDGVLDTGTLARLPIQLTAEDKLMFYPVGPTPVAVPQRRIDWVTYAGDTLLVRRHDDGFSRLHRLLYQGQVRLYRVVSDKGSRRYYLVRDGRWEAVNNGDPLAAIYAVLGQNCRSLVRVRPIRNDYQALEVARKMNDCLGVTSHYSIANYDHVPQQFGFLFSVMRGRNSRFGDREFFPQELSRPVFLPFFSLQYQRQILRKLPGLKAQLGMSFFYRDRDVSSLAISVSGTLVSNAKVDEKWRFAMLHYDPGLLYNSGFRRGLQFSLGAGAIVSLPLLARRELVIERGLPGLPNEQYLRGLIVPGLGHYTQAGIHLRLGPLTQMDLFYRRDNLNVEWNDLRRSSVVYTSKFTDQRLYVQDMERLQFRLMFKMR